MKRGVQGRHARKDGETCEGVTTTARNSPERAVPIVDCEGSASPLHRFGQSNESDTPRTDAVAPHLNLSHQDMRKTAWKLRDLCRQLEREAAHWKERYSGAE